MKIPVAIKQLDPQLPLPRYAHASDAGADLASAEDVYLAPGERKLVRTGIAIALPTGYAAFIQPRSGLASRSGLTIVNTPGTVDAGYRGEIKICLLNTDKSEPIVLKRGDLVAQMVIQQILQADFAVVSELSESDRGAGGYGSTGGISAWQQSTANQGKVSAESEGEDK